MFLNKQIQMHTYIWIRNKKYNKTHANKTKSDGLTSGPFQTPAPDSSVCPQGGGVQPCTIKCIFPSFLFFWEDLNVDSVDNHAILGEKTKVGSATDCIKKFAQRCCQRDSQLYV